jgi:serine protease
VPCAEPNCNLAYGGGTVQHTPHVYLLLWGAAWNPAGPDASYLGSFYGGLGGAPQDTWSTITSQYTDGSGPPAFGTSVLKGIFQDTGALPADVSPTDLNAEADAFVSAQGVTDLADAQIVIASQTGTCFNDGFAGNPAVCLSQPASYCAWHSNSSVGETFTNLPYQLDAGTGCGENFINAGAAGTYDGFSIVGGHEYAETITDPVPVSGWFDSADTISGGEIGDKCAWGGLDWGTPDPAGDVTLSTGSFAMQSLWSNAADGCVMAAAPPPPPLPVVTGVAPNHGPASGGTAVTVTGTALSAGTVAFGTHPATSVTCGATSCTATSPAGTGTVHVRVTTSAGTSATSAADTFSYAAGPPSGPIVGYRGKCADDAGSSTRNGNLIDLWRCTGSAGQTWTVETNGTLRVLGKCMAILNSRTANGSAIVGWSCTGGWNEVWVHRSNGELVNPHSGKCLTDPNYSTQNGTPLVLWSCVGVPNQSWSIP